MNNVSVGTTIELFWSPNGKWETGTVTKEWGNGEFSISFPDDRFVIHYLSFCDFALHAIIILNKMI